MKFYIHIFLYRIKNSNCHFKCHYVICDGEAGGRAVNGQFDHMNLTHVNRVGIRN